MGTEIERSFLVTGSVWERERTDHSRILQYGYLPPQEDDGITKLFSVCIRHITTVKGEEGRINIKSKEYSKLQRKEFETKIDPQLALEIIREACPYTLIKVRHFVGKWEIDEYLGRLNGLVIAEIEFDSLEASNIYAKPAWVGKEITEDLNYTNESIAKMPYYTKKR